MDMGMMRKLLMGGSGGERTLVSTTEPHTSTTEMPAMVMKVGASYSVSWTGTIPSATASSVYIFEILGGYSSVSRMCYAVIKKSGRNINLTIALFGATQYSTTVSAGDSIDLELRFTVNDVSDTSPYYNSAVEVYKGGEQVAAKRNLSETDAGYGLRYYKNLAGTFIVKRLS